MKTLIISSSLSETSNSFILCKEAATELKNLGAEVEVFDARKIELLPYGRGPTKGMTELTEKITKCDNIIFGMGVYCYSINDSLKIIIDNCLEEATEKFFGILCAAGGQKSYLATQHLTQICMNEARMMQLPRVVYAVDSDFDSDKVTNPEVKKRLALFAKEFYTIGNKLLK